MILSFYDDAMSPVISLDVSSDADAYDAARLRLSSRFAAARFEAAAFSRSSNAVEQHVTSRNIFRYAMPLIFFRWPPCRRAAVARFRHAGFDHAEFRDFR